MMIRIMSVLVFVAACSSSKLAPKPVPEKPVPEQPVPENPDRRLTHAECEAAVDHAIELAAEPAMNEAVVGPRLDRASAISECERTATVRDRDCLMQATTMDELGLCPQPGTRLCDDETSRLQAPGRSSPATARSPCRRQTPGCIPRPARSRACSPPAG